MAKNVWFNNVKAYLQTRGHKGHTAVPYIRAGRKTIEVGKCPKCAYKLGLIFRSNKDSNVYILACKKCNKFSIASNGTPKCNCGKDLPPGRKKFCHECRSPKNNSIPKGV